ncbi:hypothetical protein [Reyranella sp. CPCC 100927]|nr:hypothetical protein [Reyranella sp. CPCC 100927]
MLVLLRACVVVGVVALLGACNTTSSGNDPSGCCIRAPSSY